MSNPTRTPNQGYSHYQRGSNPTRTPIQRPLTNVTQPLTPIFQTPLLNMTLGDLFAGLQRQGSSPFQAQPQIVTTHCTPDSVQPPQLKYTLVVRLVWDSHHSCLRLSSKMVYYPNSKYTTGQAILSAAPLTLNHNPLSPPPPPEIYHDQCITQNFIQNITKKEFVSPQYKNRNTRKVAHKQQFLNKEQYIANQSLYKNPNCPTNRCPVSWFDFCTQ